MALALIAALGEMRQGRHHYNARVQCERTEPLQIFNNFQLIKRYRFDRHAIQRLVELSEPTMGRPTASGISVESQVCVALNYMATGSTLTTVGDLHGVHRITAGRCVRDFAKTMCRLAPEHIVFPRDLDSQTRVMEGLYDLAQFPRAIGCVDGSLIPIMRPSVDEFSYVCRKGYHAINAQGVCDANYKFTNLVAKWGGATHDSFILRDSVLWNSFLNNELEGGWLLGDSAYAASKHLMSPIPGEQLDAAERKYNRCHRKTRFVIENTFGIWKAHFRCLHKLGGKMMFEPARCCRIILATAVLHNMARDLKMPEPDDYALFIDRDPDITLDQEQWVYREEEGIRLRSALIENTFRPRLTG